ncbi:MAG: hypothetical protein C4308_09295 [Chitinophagaceae bacterium]
MPNNISKIRHREVHKPSFSAGLLATKQLSSKWSVNTGLVYSQTVIGILPQNLYAFQVPGGDIVYKYITSSAMRILNPAAPHPLLVIA